VQAYLQEYEQDKKKVNSVYEARCLAESTSSIPPLVNTILNQAVASLKVQGDASYLSERTEDLTTEHTTEELEGSLG